MRLRSASATRVRDAQPCDRASRVDVEPKLDIAQYQMLKLQINLMNFSAVTIFLARVVRDTVCSRNRSFLSRVSIAAPQCLGKVDSLSVELYSTDSDSFLTSFHWGPSEL